MIVAIAAVGFLLWAGWPWGPIGLVIALAGAGIYANVKN